MSLNLGNIVFKPNSLAGSSLLGTDLSYSSILSSFSRNTIRSQLDTSFSNALFNDETKFPLSLRDSENPPESKVTATCKDIDYIWNGTRWFPETQNNGEPNNQGSSENQGSGNSGGGGSNNPLRRN